MNIDELPLGSNPKPLDFPHFPTRHQLFVWRNWELVPVERLAGVLGTSAGKVLDVAAGMGLRVPPVVNERWLQRGYLTLLRNNWHVLPYEQLMQLLGWTADQVAYALKEEDFLFHKLGFLKPAAAPVQHRPLTAEESARTAQLRALVKKHFPDIRRKGEEPPFAFLDKYAEQVPPASGAGQDKFELQYMYSYAALYGDPLLDEASDPFPDGLLTALSRQGVTGVWLQGILYTLVPWDRVPGLSAGWEQRLENLRKLTARAGRHGMGVYLYLNEPRCIPLKWFEKIPELRGVRFAHEGVATLCTSQKPVIDFLKNSTARLFREVPDLAGVFTITMSENPTNCYSRKWWQPEQCPRCTQRPNEDVVAEVNRAIEEGVHSAKPDARVIVWTWGWEPEWGQKAVDLLPKSVYLMCTSEEAMPMRIGGQDLVLGDYAISQVGPGERSKGYWEHARKRGMKTVAKVQLNTTWECSAVPYLPAMDLIERHIQNLREVGVDGLMLSWTVGGYPSPNLELLRKSSARIAAERFGPRAAPLVRKAWRAFSDAFPEFPHQVGVLYNGPENYGPMNLLYAKKTGYHATMIGFPYDDVEHWRAAFPEAVLETQFRKLSEGWKKGLGILRRARAVVRGRERTNLDDLDRVATAAYCHFRSSYLQTAFIRRRERKDAASRQMVRKILAEEIKIAKTLHDIIRKDSRIGFEASNHYYYTANDLREKVLNCEHLRAVLAAPQRRAGGKRAR